MNKAEALKLYGKVFEIQGEHNGRWENEYIQEDSSMQYHQEMTEIADELNIQYEKDPHAYADEEEDLFEYQYLDIMGCEVKELILKHLRDIILD